MTPRLAPFASLVGLGLLVLGACTDAAGLAPREGPQTQPVSGAQPVGQPVATAPAIAPASASPAPAPIPAVARADDPAQALFAEFCLPYPTAAASEAAVVASGRFSPVQETLIADGTIRYATYLVLGMDRASVTLAYNTGSDIQCGVGVNNAGPTLYEDGRIG
jgi:hypothetical protein